MLDNVFSFLVSFETFFFFPRSRKWCCEVFVPGEVAHAGAAPS